METIEMEAINAKKKTLREVNGLIREGLESGPVTVSGAAHLHGLGAGLRHGDLTVEGGAGDYLGVLNAGATIEVEGDVGNYAADNMTGGKVIIHGSAGFGAGEYCYGGTLVISGSAGDFTATMNKGASIFILGSVGEEVGTYMLAGKLVILGSAGANFANCLIRGTIYIQGEVRSLGHNAKFSPLADEDRAFLADSFRELGIQADASRFRKIVAVSQKPFYN